MVVTLTALQELVNWLAGSSATAPTHIAIGSDNSSPDDEETQLVNEVGRTTITSVLTDENSVTFSATLLSTELNGEVLREAGLFNASTSGDMFNRNTNATITKTANVEVIYEITLNLTN